MSRRIIIAGGGTGGHIFPAIAIAGALQKIDPSIELLFVGAKGKMEMEKIPQAGYRIEGIDIAGFNRSSLIKNAGLPFKLIKSFFQVGRILRAFRPDAVIGVGGYSSFPVLRAAQARGIPTFIHESNSFAGKSNILLGKKATRIFVASDGMEKFFPSGRIVITGNPVRHSIVQSKVSREEAIRHFGLNPSGPVVLATGGSLGAKGINQAIAAHLDEFGRRDIQLIWQTGKPFAAEAAALVAAQTGAQTTAQTATPVAAKPAGHGGIWTNDFIPQMEYAFAAADVVISRSGAMSIAELCVVAKPVVFVPFPFAAEDHQTVNAQHLVDKKAALLVRDSEAKDHLVSTTIGLVQDKALQQQLKENIGRLAVRDAAGLIANEILDAIGPNMGNAPGPESILTPEKTRMVELKDIKRIYFIGIGGIGMSALARYFHFHGKAVSGYDRTATALTRQLEDEGIPVHYEDDPAAVPKDADLVVYTPAVPKDHREWLYYKEHGYPLLKRSEVLGMITSSSFNICVAGTHGKTTVTTMIAHILRHSGYGCNAFLGGIAVNYNSNFFSDPRNVCVIEADEYDRSFLKLSPDIAVITAMDADHLDIYGTAEAVQQAFIDFSGRLKPGGLLVTKEGLEKAADLKGDHHWTYGLVDYADFFASDITVDQGDYLFNVQTGDWRLERIVLTMGGRHNVENATAAIAVAHHLGIAGDKIIAAVAVFRGVKRRFEYIVKKPGRVFIDDYAHHPEELRAVISGAKELFGGMKCTIIFQPHLFTRTRDFVDGFAESLDLADEVFLLPIYPARELPIEGVTSQLIAGKMKPGKATVVDKQEILTIIKDKVAKDDLKLLITAGAGDIDTLVEPIRKLL